MEFGVHASYGFTVHKYLVIHKMEVLSSIMDETIKIFRRAICFNNYEDLK